MFTGAHVAIRLSLEPACPIPSCPHDAYCKPSHAPSHRSAVKPVGPWYSPKCDNNFSPPKCSDLYHMQEQSPGYPHGDGDCAPPGCDCGNQPCGFYMWNHSATKVVNGQTFRDWFIESYVFNHVGSSPLVSGYFFDDHWSATGGFPDSSAGRIVQDTGMTPNDLQTITADYYANMAALNNVTLARGKFAWQLFYTGGAADSVGSTGPSPLVHNTTCAADLRSLCSATSPAQTRTLMYGFAAKDPAHLDQFEVRACAEALLCCAPKLTIFLAPGPPPPAPPPPRPAQADLANFLLIRGPYAYLGHGWKGCSRTYEYPDALAADYGEPVDSVCTETAPGSGVFTREWTKATVSMDCKTFTPTITMK